METRLTSVKNKKKLGTFWGWEVQKQKVYISTYLYFMFYILYLYFLKKFTYERMT